jgi:DNA replication factor GINS
MNVSELQSVQARERQSDSVQELRPTFYRDAATYVAELRDERARVAADAEDPFEDPEVTRLTDDVRTAERTIEAIYERRIGKVVKLASLAAADMPAEETGLTTEERALYETLVGAIETHREDVLASIKETDSSTASSSSGPDGSATDRPKTEAAAAAGHDGGLGPPDVMESGDDRSTADSTEPGSGDASSPGGEEAPERGESASSEGATRSDGPSEAAAGERGADRTTVRITEDVGAILGVDEREYDLATDDVVTLPAENATPLIERDAAEPIE